MIFLSEDAALIGLLQEWLHAEDVRAVHEHPREPYAGANLAVVDLPFSKAATNDLLEHVRRAHPGVPVIALSARFLPGVQASGGIARALGVDAALSKPVQRERFAAVARSLLERPRKRQPAS